MPLECETARFRISNKREGCENTVAIRIDVYRLSLQSTAPIRIADQRLGKPRRSVSGKHAEGSRWNTLNKRLTQRTIFIKRIGRISAVVVDPERQTCGGINLLYTALLNAQFLNIVFVENNGTNLQRSAYRFAGSGIATGFTPNDIEQLRSAVDGNLTASVDEGIGRR